MTGPGSTHRFRIAGVTCCPPQGDTRLERSRCWQNCRAQVQRGGFLPWYKREGTRYPRLILLCLYLCFTFSVAGDFTGLSMPKSISFVSTEVLTASKVCVDGIRRIEGRLYCMDLTLCQEEKCFPFICKVSLTNLEESCAFLQRGQDPPVEKNRAVCSPASNMGARCNYPSIQTVHVVHKYSRGISYRHDGCLMPPMFSSCPLSQ